MNTINIEKLIKEEEIVLSDFDIFYSCRDEDVKEQYYYYIENGDKLDEEEKKKFITEFIEKNINNISLERLLLYGMRNKEARINAIREHLKKMIAKANSIPQTDMYGKIKAGKDIEKMQKYIVNEKEKLERLKKSVKGLDICIATSYYNTNEGKPDLEILDSKVILEEKRPNKEKRLKKAEKFFDKLKQIQQENIDGFRAFLYVIPVNEILGVFPNEEFSEAAFNYCLNMCAWNSGVKSQVELQRVRDSEEFYAKYLEGKDGDFITDIVYPTVLNFVEYADIDQLVMIGAYRLNYALETEKYAKADTEVIRQVLEEIVKYARENKISSKYKIKLKDSEWREIKEIDYSVDDINKCLKKFIDGKYIDDDEIQALRKSVDKGMLYLSQIPGPLLNIMYAKEDFSQLMFLNERNFKDTLEIVNLSKNQILVVAEKVGLNSIKNLTLLLSNDVIEISDIVEMYLYDKIEENVTMRVLQSKDEKEIIDFQLLIDLYEEDETKEKYSKYLDFCKKLIDKAMEKEACLIEDDEERKNKQMQIHREFSEKFMEIFAENYNPAKREEYINQLENFYKEGLLEIESIINWEDEAIVARFLKDRIIDSTIVKKLMAEKTISVQYAQSLFGECILDPEMDNETRIKLIKSGLISADYIGKAYQLSLIKSSLADELTEAGYFEKSKYDNVSISDLQENAKIKLGDLRSLTKIRTDFSEKPGKSPKRDYEKSKDKGILIDPDAREDLFELLKARKAESLEIQPDDPFYNYEFYVLPDENNEYGPNSVVIAERYFTNKDTMKTFATQNATYFFKWRDLLYISNLKKSEIAKESKDIVFRAHHVVSDGTDRAGSWGGSVLTSIGKTMMGREVRKYGKKSVRKKALERLKSIYSEEQWERINDHAIDIDVGEYSFKNLTASYSSDDDDPHSDGLR